MAGRLRMRLVSRALRRTVDRIVIGWFPILVLSLLLQRLLDLVGILHPPWAGVDPSLEIACLLVVAVMAVDRGLVAIAGLRESELAEDEIEARRPPRGDENR